MPKKAKAGAASIQRSYLVAHIKRMINSARRKCIPGEQALEQLLEWIRGTAKRTSGKGGIGRR